MLTQASWLPLAQQLALGQRQRTDHDCGGAAKTLILRRDERGLHAHCFRCNDSGWQPAPPEPLEVRLKRLAQAQVADDRISASCALPEPRVPWSLWPPECRLWFLKAGLSGADAGVLGAYYHPPSDRVVVPVLGAAGPVFWQARAVQRGRQPKYLAPPVDKTTIVPRWGSAADVTLTEDLLSAYKVGTVGEGWCLMGTSISPGCLTALLERGARVNVWLDPDGAGHKGATKVLATLRGAGLIARRVLSKRDPKLMHRVDIKEILTWQSSK